MASHRFIVLTAAIGVIIPILLRCAVIIEATNYDSYKEKSEAYNVPDLIRWDGYPVEIHHITTEDGYVLELHRIPDGKKQNPKCSFKNDNTSLLCTEYNKTQNLISSSNEIGQKQKPVVLLIHCMFCSSAAYVVLGPNGGLAYMLANDGYDVWMMNSRGTSYSQRHKKLSKKSTKFWQFSWHEHGVSDIPATIDYVLKLTGESQLDAIGYSMGTTQLFVTLSMRPEYNKKIRKLVVLAPAGYVSNSETPMASYVDLILGLGVNIFGGSGRLQMPPPAWHLPDLFSNVCKPNSPFIRNLCIKALRFSGGNNGRNIKRRVLPFYYKFFPESVAFRTVAHFSQLVVSGKFQQFDFGRSLNIRRYGSSSPPAYNISQITAPTHVFYSLSDSVTVPNDVLRFVNLLPNMVSLNELSDKTYSHADFIWAKTAHIVIYKKVLKILQQGR